MKTTRKPKRTAAVRDRGTARPQPAPAATARGAARGPRVGGRPHAAGSPPPRAPRPPREAS
jgi:hypothetical protein